MIEAIPYPSQIGFSANGGASQVRSPSLPSVTFPPALISLIRESNAQGKSARVGIAGSGSAADRHVADTPR